MHKLYYEASNIQLWNQLGNFNHNEIKQKLTEGDATIPDTAQAIGNENMKQSKGVETT
jgi:hypothetical protein